MGENGKRFIDKLIAASPLERRKIATVLGQDIYVKPPTRKALNDAMPKDDENRDPDYVGLFLIVAFAEDEAGNKLFTVRDIDALREAVALELLVEIEGKMMAAIQPSAKEADKAIAANPPSASA
jgi:hypothetical protein